MNCAKKRLSSWLLDSTLLLCLSLGFSIAHAEELGVVAHYLIPTQKTDPCSIVNIHSLNTKADGTTLYQKGQGWITKLRKQGSEHQLGVVLPYHVVVNASEVYGECRGVYFSLSEPVIDAEADLVHLVISDGKLLANGTLSPLLVELATQKLRDVIYSTDSVKGIFSQPLSPQEMRKQLPEVLNSAISFGVAMAPAGSSELAFLMSPNGYDIVSGAVDASQDPLDRYIRIENFGIRPGVSGAALFGIPANPLFRSYDLSKNKVVYQAPIEMIPKTVLGMVTKTKLNGAETVAISLPDITRFLEFHVIQGLPLLEKRYEVHYRESQGTDQSVELQSYLSLLTADASVPVQETCSAEFKQSADFSPLMDPKLKNISEDFKKKPDFKIKNLQHQLNDLTHRSKANENFLKDLENLQKLQKKSGGGEYGEGGGGFASRQAQFLTSRSYVGSFSRSDVGFNAQSEVASFGLYLKNQSCPEQSLLLGDRRVNTLALKGKPLQRLVTYEDLRRAAKYGTKSAEILLAHARYETRPFFTFEEAWGEPLTIPLLSVQAVSSTDPNWKPGGKDYFKEKLTAAQKSSSFVTVSNQSLELNTQLTGISDSQKMGWLQLTYKEGSWQGRFALNSHCEVRLKSENFKAIHPWLVQYKDEGNDIKIEMGVQNRLLSITFQKVACENIKNLALGEIEIIPNGASQVITGSTRRNFLALPINLETLRQALKKAQDAGEQK